jgi:hypothetical protein
MAPTDPSLHPQIASIEHLGRRYTVSCRVAFDGIEYVGRLWFTDEDLSEPGLPDRAAIPGRTKEEVIDQARRLTPAELGLRHRRALAEKRRYLQLRRVTDDILTKIRYINQIAISMRDGMLDAEGARQEIELTEKQLHECVERLREAAGVED